MSVRIRLRRMGAKKRTHFRIVVADKRSPRDGRFLEAIGIYDPVVEPAKIEIDRNSAHKDACKDCHKEQGGPTKCNDCHKK